MSANDNGNVVAWTGITRLDLDPDRVINAALGQLTEVVVLGYDHDGEEYFASSSAGGGDVLWLLERAKMKLLGVPDRLQED